MAGEALGIFALGWVFSRWMGSDIPVKSPETASMDIIEENGPDLPPPVSLSPDALGMPLFYVEQVQSSEDGLEVVYCLYQLEGVAYQYEDGTIEDSTNYVKIGFVIGNSSATAFLSESRGGYDFILYGIEYENVSVFTKSDAIAKVTDDEDDSDGPQKPEPPTEPSPSPTLPMPDYSLGLGGGMRRGGVY